MSKLRRIVLVRHGETTGESSIRFHGATDVPLSDSGRAHMREVAKRLAQENFDLVVASSLRRSWQAAWIVSGGAPVRLEPRFREIDFGRWEGLSKQEIAAADPQLYEDWQSKGAAFDFPGGETRSEFRARTLEGLENLKNCGATCALVVAHKGTMRSIVEELLGSTLADGEPQLGGHIGLSCAANGSWNLGRRGSNPAGLEAALTGPRQPPRLPRAPLSLRRVQIEAGVGGRDNLAGHSQPGRLVLVRAPDGAAASAPLLNRRFSQL